MRGAATVPEARLPATVTPSDQARAIDLVLRRIGVRRVDLAFGASLGGMATLALASIAGERLERACVAWGLDGPMKAEFGAAPVDTNSFAFGLDRMFAGYVLGCDTGEALLDDCVLPAAPIMGPEVDVLGALDRVLQILRDLRESARGAYTAADWSVRFEQLVTDLFLADPADPAESAALKEVRRLITKIPADVADAGGDVDPLLPFAVFSEALRESLAGIP